MSAAVGAVDVVEVEWTPTRRDVGTTVGAMQPRWLALMALRAMVAHHGKRID